MLIFIYAPERNLWKSTLLLWVLNLLMILSRTAPPFLLHVNKTSFQNKALFLLSVIPKTLPFQEKKYKKIQKLRAGRGSHEKNSKNKQKKGGGNEKPKHQLRLCFHLPF